MTHPRTKRCDYGFGSLPVGAVFFPHGLTTPCVKTDEDSCSLFVLCACGCRYTKRIDNMPMLPSEVVDAECLG